MNASATDRSSAPGRAAELLLMVVAAVAGLAWALPAAGIGLTLGFCLVGMALGAPWPMPRPVVLAAVACSGVVAYLSATSDLGVGYRFIPAVVPFLLLAVAVPSVVRGAR